MGNIYSTPCTLCYKRKVHPTSPHRKHEKRRKRMRYSFLLHPDPKKNASTIKPQPVTPSHKNKTNNNNIQNIQKKKDSPPTLQRSNAIRRVPASRSRSGSSSNPSPPTPGPSRLHIRNITPPPHLPTSIVPTPTGIFTSTPSTLQTSVSRSTVPTSSTTSPTNTTVISSNINGSRSGCERPRTVYMLDGEIINDYREGSESPKLELRWIDALRAPEAPGGFREVVDVVEERRSGRLTVVNACGDEGKASEDSQQQTRGKGQDVAKTWPGASGGRQKNEEKEMEMVQVSPSVWRNVVKGEEEHRWTMEPSQPQDHHQHQHHRPSQPHQPHQQPIPFPSCPRTPPRHPLRPSHLHSLHPPSTPTSTPTTSRSPNNNSNNNPRHIPLWLLPIDHPDTLAPTPRIRPRDHRLHHRLRQSPHHSRGHRYIDATRPPVLPDPQTPSPAARSYQHRPAHPERHTGHRLPAPVVDGSRDHEHEQAFAPRRRHRAQRRAPIPNFSDETETEMEMERKREGGRKREDGKEREQVGEQKVLEGVVKGTGNGRGVPTRRNGYEAGEVVGKKDESEDRVTGVGKEDDEVKVEVEGKEDDEVKVEVEGKGEGVGVGEGENVEGKEKEGEGEEEKIDWFWIHGDEGREGGGVVRYWRGRLMF